MSKERLDNSVLKNAISTYKTVVEVAGDIIDEDYSPVLDKVTLALLEELKQYRDLEEQGLLLRLPCKVGDTVYSFSFGEVFCAEIIEIKYICEAENYGKFIRQKITIDEEECGITIIDFSDIGKRYFLTQSEAEEKLRELEG